MFTMLKNSKLLMALAVIVFMLSGPLSGGASAISLWTDSSSLFADRKACQIGDILTVIISESSSATRNGSTNNTKAATGSTEHGKGLFKFVNDSSYGGTDTFQAKGVITNANQMSGRLSVQVIAVKPNGNLVISGSQMTRQAGEEQRITITGVIRPEDITAANTIYSSHVANAQIKIEGKGPIADKQKQGLLSQILNFLF
ncbi:MAG: flgH [Firmicutes bacterium]|nr:flgH [Bacillota bacterium]